MGGKGANLSSILRASQSALDYRHLNENFPSAESMAKIGTRLWGLAVACSERGVYFKLNAGRIGLATTPGAMLRFRDMQVGDAVLCCVSGLSIDGKYIYLDRYDHDWDYFDNQMRPSPEPEVGVYGREHRHESSCLADAGDSQVDPLLVRGLLADEAESLGALRAMDSWEVEPEDLGLPPDANL